MTLDDIRKVYYFMTNKASSNVRTIAYAGIVASIVFGPLLRVEVVEFFLLAIMLDFLQYAVAAAVWGVIGRLVELKKMRPNTLPRWVNYPALIFFWSKIIAITIGLWYLTV